MLLVSLLDLQLAPEGFDWGYACRELEWTSDEAEATVVERLVQRKTAHSLANLEVCLMQLLLSQWVQTEKDIPACSQRARVCLALLQERLVLHLEARQGPDADDRPIAISIKVAFSAYVEIKAQGIRGCRLLLSSCWMPLDRLVYQGYSPAQGRLSC